MPLIEITETAYPIKLELRYASENNFTGKRIYKNSKCFLHEAAIPLFEKAIILADKQGLLLKIFDAFRPKAAAQSLWDFCPNPTYVADPKKGSHHTRGVAIDLTLLDKSGSELPMGTPFDDFTEISHHSAVLPKEIAANRFLLLGIMISSGWDFYMNEWWHYQLFCPKDYSLLESDYGIMS